jgi:hypothetical protein
VVAHFNFIGRVALVITLEGFVRGFQLHEDLGFYELQTKERNHGKDKDSFHVISLLITLSCLNRKIKEKQMRNYTHTHTHTYI